MSLQLAAQHLSAHGRGPDTTLVHMAPKEVAGLQALAMRHGGSLTINPQTGLPEAGFLSSILPMLGGIALAATGIGAPAAALLMGGGTAAITGDLKKGLMAGLGAYGGAGLGESLIGSGAAGLLPEAAAASLQTPAAEGVASAIPQAATTAAETVAGSTPTLASGATPIESTFSNASNANYITPGGPVLPTTTTPPITTTPFPVQPPSIENMTAGQRFDALKSGATGDNLWNYAKAHPLQTAGMVAGPLMALSENNTPTVSTSDSDRGAMANAGYQYDQGWVDPMPKPDPYGREQIYNRPRYYIPKAAEGGIASLAGGGITSNGSAGNNQYAAYAAGGEVPSQYNLGSYSDGGRLLRGPGDGVSDDIPAVIGEKQPARLADGEFVVPARIVSEIGNGSTEAGARKLYAMMDKVQNARKATVGKDKIARNTRADRYLPA